MPGAANAVKAIGGNIMAHATTTRLKLSKAGQGKRKIKLEASPYIPEAECEYMINEHGVLDVDSR